MIQNLIYGILFLKILFRACNFFYVRPHVPVNIIRVFLNFRFSSRKSQHQQKIAKKITYSTVQFLSKNVTNNKLNMGHSKSMSLA